MVFEIKFSIFLISILILMSYMGVIIYHDYQEDEDRKKEIQQIVKDSESSLDKMNRNAQSSLGRINNLDSKTLQNKAVSMHSVNSH